MIVCTLPQALRERARALHIDDTSGTKQLLLDAANEIESLMNPTFEMLDAGIGVVAQAGHVDEMEVFRHIFIHMFAASTLMNMEPRI